MPAPTFIVAVPLLAILAVATWSDLRSRRIPNALSLGGAVLGILVNTATFGVAGAAFALVGWLLCLACFLPLYVSGGTAAGDVKLMAAVGAFLGPIYGFVACLVALLAGALLAALCIASQNVIEARREPRAENTRSSPSGHELAEPLSPSANALQKIPYAGAIALGAAAAVLQPSWLTSLLPLGAI
jgi:prepilin peptidase CpaA